MQLEQLTDPEHPVYRRLPRPVMPIASAGFVDALGVATEDDTRDLSGGLELQPRRSYAGGDTPAKAEE
jgi:hypothetical protein